MIGKKVWIRGGIAVVTLAAVLAGPGCKPKIGDIFMDGKADCRGFTDSLRDSYGRKFSHGAEFRSKQDDTAIIFDHETVYFPGFRIGFDADFGKIKGEFDGSNRSFRAGVGNPATGDFYQFIGQPFGDGWQVYVSDRTGILDSMVFQQGSERQPLELEFDTVISGASGHSLTLRARGNSFEQFANLLTVDGRSNDLNYVVSYGGTHLTKGETVRFGGFSGSNAAPSGMLPAENQFRYHATCAYDNLENAKSVIDDCPSGYLSLAHGRLRDAEDDLNDARVALAVRYEFKKADPVKKTVKEIDKTLALISKAGEFVSKPKPPGQKAAWKKVVRAQKRCVKLIQSLANLPDPEPLKR